MATASSIRAAELVASFEVLGRGPAPAAHGSQPAGPVTRGQKRQAGAPDDAGRGKRQPLGPAAGTRAATARKVNKAGKPPIPQRSTRQAAPQHPADQPAAQHPAAAGAAPSCPTGGARREGQQAAAAAAPSGAAAAPAAAPNGAAAAPAAAPSGAAAAPEAAPSQAAAAAAAAPTGPSNQKQVILPPSVQRKNLAAQLVRQAAGSTHEEEASSAFRPLLPTGPPMALPAAGQPAITAPPRLWPTQQQPAWQPAQPARQQAWQPAQLSVQQQVQRQAWQPAQQQAPPRRPVSLRPQPEAGWQARRAPALPAPVEAPTVSTADMLLQLAAAVEDPAAQQAGLTFRTLQHATTVFESWGAHNVGRVALIHNYLQQGRYRHAAALIEGAAALYAGA